jgi:endoglucanase
MNPGKIADRLRLALIAPAGAAVLALGPAACVSAEGPSPNTGSAAGADEGGKCPPDALIDDMEDDNNQVAPNKGRTGYWYTFVDKAGSTAAPPPGGTFAMAAGGAEGSTHAAHLSGKVGTGQTVYAGMGFNFVEPKAPYDASAYKGVSFWAKVGPGSLTKVRAKLSDVNTDPDGKVCSQCYNDFGADLELTEKWTKYTLLFSSIKQLDGWGAPHVPAITPSKLYAMQWQVNTPGANYDIWVDNIAFVGCK